MKIICVMVMSANGKITLGRNPNVHDWSSKEDQRYFAAIKEKATLIIMGRKTYKVASGQMALSAKTLRVVLTKRLGAYKKQAVAGQLEFTDELPETLIEKLERRGYKKALLVGGSEINSAFFGARLIDELWLTIEPKIFGRGTSIVSEKNFTADLRLKSSEQLNKNGTVLLKYEVL